MIPELIDLEVTIDEAIEWLEDEYADYTQSRDFWEHQYNLEKEDGYEDNIQDFVDKIEYYAKRQLMSTMAISALKKSVRMHSTPTDSQNLIDYVEKRLDEAKHGIEDPSRVDELERLITWMLSKKESKNNE